MLKLDGVQAGYGKSMVLQGVDLEVRDGEAVALLGRNGVGKSTTLRAIMGLTPPRRGTIVFDGARVDTEPAHKVPRRGIGYVPQGRRIFPNLSVMDNLCLGLPRAPTDGDLAPIFRRFPRLRERLGQRGGTLSGGEQQMLAIARCLIVRPKILLLDEPTEGIMPRLVADLREEIRAINETGVSILFVEQNIRAALAICTRVYIMEKGAVCCETTSEALRADPGVVRRYLGVSI